jgi:hypothetical protein
LVHFGAGNKKAMQSFSKVVHAFDGHLILDCMALTCKQYVDDQYFHLDQFVMEEQLLKLDCFDKAIVLGLFKNGEKLV